MSARSESDELKRVCFTNFQVRLKHFLLRKSFSTHCEWFLRELLSSFLLHSSTQQSLSNRERRKNFKCFAKFFNTSPSQTEFGFDREIYEETCSVAGCKSVAGEVGRTDSMTLSVLCGTAVRVFVTFFSVAADVKNLKAAGLSASS